MSLLDSLTEKEAWQSFLEYRKERNRLSKKELKELESFIAEERYLPPAKTLEFGYPEKREISKLGSSKKRTVYSYSPDETWLLKFIAFGLYRYDGKMADGCYSFRRNVTAKTAFADIREIEGLDGKWVLKLDVRDYFNSIDADMLIDMLKDTVDDDPPLLELMETLLLQDKCVYKGELLSEKRGAMAGVPLASFFANLYLKDLDLAFEKKGIPCFRYSDDIIMFFGSERELEEGFAFAESLIRGKKLSLNMDKYKVSRPGEKWDFLGFSYHKGEIDLADATVKKMEGKIRRKARALWRWRQRKDASFERAAKAMINSFDRKFYDLSGDGERTWTGFYFPVITAAEGLKKIDACMQKYLRFLYSGRHYKGNYRVSYGDLKKLGYTPLAAEYYNWKKENEMLKKGTL